MHNTYQSVMTYMNESCYKYEWGMTCMNKVWLIFMRHGTLIEAWHIWISHRIHEGVMKGINDAPFFHSMTHSYMPQVSHTQTYLRRRARVAAAQTSVFASRFPSIPPPPSPSHTLPPPVFLFPLSCLPSPLPLTTLFRISSESDDNARSCSCVVSLSCSSACS